MQLLESVQNQSVDEKCLAQQTKSQLINLTMVSRVALRQLFVHLYPGLPHSFKENFIGTHLIKFLPPHYWIFCLARH